MLHSFDVIIVGAGPAGSACATFLAQQKVNVLLLDKAKFPREKICGDCINPKSWKFFELLGIAHTLRALSPNIINTFRITAPDGAALTQPVVTNSFYPFFSIPRSDLDNMLLRNAQQTGATVEEETLVTEIRRTERWEVVVRKKNGALARLTSKILVGAEGRNSIVAKNFRRMSGSLRRMEHSMVGDARKSERVGIQWRTTYQPQIGSSVEMVLFDSGYCGIVNTGQDSANVAMVTGSDAASLAKHDFSRFLQKTVLSNSTARTRIYSLVPLGEFATAYPINPTTHYTHHPEAFLIGDAHRTVEPFTGEGVFFALQDGYHTSRNILQQLGRDTLSNHVSSHSTFWVNSVFSPALRNQKITQNLITVGERMPKLVPLVMKTVFEVGDKPMVP